MGQEASENVVVSIRMPKELRRRVKAQAAELDMTVQEVVVSLLREWLERVGGAGKAEHKAQDKE